MSNQLVSFILPIYKTPQDYLQKCVESICQQSYTNIEILLVNDGSPIECSTFCDMLAQSDSRIRVIHQENQGVSSARNRGVQEASGYWLSFIDPDDWIDEKMLTQVFEQVSKYSDYSLDVIFWNYIKEYGKNSETMAYFANDKKLYSTKEDLQTLHILGLELTSGVGSVWAKLYRREFLIENNLTSNINLPRGQDVEFNFRVFGKISSALYIPSALYHYRYDDDTASTAFNKNFKDYLTRFVEALHKDVDNLQNSQKFTQKLYERSIHALLAISVRYTFHKKNSANYKQKKHEFVELCKQEVFAKSIQNVEYKNFSTARKIALFCLKHNLFFGTFLIAKVRQIQYKVKQ